MSSLICSTAVHHAILMILNLSLSLINFYSKVHFCWILMYSLYRITSSISSNFALSLNLQQCSIYIVHDFVNRESLLLTLSHLVLVTLFSCLSNNFAFVIVVVYFSLTLVMFVFLLQTSVGSLADVPFVEKAKFPLDFFPKVSDPRFHPVSHALSQMQYSVVLY